MARSRRESVRVEEPVEGTEDRTPRLPGDDSQRAVQEQELDTILQQLGSGARIRVDRVSLETGMAAYAGMIAAAGFSLEQLTETFGGGNYLLYVPVPTETEGESRIVQFPLQIDPSIPAKNPRAPRGSSPSGTSAVDTMMAMMAASAAQNQQSMQMMTTMMQGFATALTAMMTARPAERDPVELALRLKDMMQPAQRTPLAELNEVLALAERLKGGSGDDGTLALIGKGIDAVTEIAKRNPPAPASLPAGSGKVRYPVTPIPAASDSSPTMPPNSRPWITALLPYLNVIRMNAGTGSPSTLANVLRERLPSAEWNDLVQDAVADMDAGDAITLDAVRPFAKRSLVALQLESVHEDWLCGVAKEVVEIANRMASPEPVSPPGSADDEEE